MTDDSSILWAALCGVALCCHCAPVVPRTAAPHTAALPAVEAPPAVAAPARDIEYIVRPKDLVMVPKTRRELEEFLPGAPAVTPFSVLRRRDKRVWHPRAAFGPFFAGSDLSQIQIRLGPGGGWYHNAFFSTTTDAATFRRYYPSSGWPPAEVTPEPNPANSLLPNLQEPGAFPAAAGFNDALLQLASVHYTSQYGGSLRLVFRAAEDNEVELRSADAMWDLKGLELSIFVVPRAKLLNATRAINPGLEPEIVHSQLGYTRATQYTLPNSQRRFEAALLDLPKLKGALAFTLGANLSETASRFAHGFLHAQLQDAIAPNDLVDAIDISDNYVQIWTHEAVAYMAVEMQVGNITAPGHLGFAESGEYDYDVSLTPSWVIRTDGDPPFHRLPATTETLSLRGHEISRWHGLGRWLASDCSNLHSVSTSIAIQETNAVDDFVGGADATTREFDTFSSYWWVFGDCSAVNAAATARKNAVIQDQAETHDVTEGRDKKGTVVVRSRLRVFFR